MLATAIHRRQFVLGPEAWREYPDWSVIRLPACGMLSCCPTLPVRIISDASGTPWALLGVALQADPARRDPALEIAAAVTPRVSQLGATWSGRWVLIGDGRVYPDAAGLLGCYYWKQQSGSGDRSDCWVSSSVALLGRAAAQHGSSRIDHVLARERGVDWFPPPSSSRSGVRRLLPSQLLDLRQGRPEPRSWLPALALRRSYEDVLGEVRQLLMTPLQRLEPRPGATIWVPLTGGFDSRLVLAAALRAGLSVRTYTNYRRGMSLGDSELPQRVARVAGVPHEWHRPGRLMPQAVQEYDLHSAGETAGIDRAYFASGQWDFAAPADVVLRGGGFEAGRCYYYRSFPTQTGPNPPAPAAIAEALHDPPGSPVSVALAEWIAMAQQNQVPGLDWRDRLYLEQRLGGWLSAVEQSLDLAFAERVHVANAAMTYALLLGLPQSVRSSSRHQRDLIASLVPALADLPFNPPEGAFGPWTRMRYRLREDPWALVRSALKRLHLG